ncbi:MAG: HAD family hydrolase [Candidatus Roizmanbacteria bacterium]|nr:HAD family hydrolase [Candidatus Roizmanbacteria bacterium]
MKYKLLALDIDETLTTESEDSVSPAVLKALHLASEKMHVTFVTARAINGLTKFLDNIRLPAQYHVVENGAKVLRPDRSIVYEHYILDREVQQILDIAQPYFLETGFLADERWVDDTHASDSVTGLSFTCTSKEDEELLKSAITELPQDFSIYSGRHWTVSDWRAVLVFHKNATKGSGMKYIQKKLGISKEETIAVGDGMTDLSMFDAAGLKIAMENGEPSMKEAADYVCPSVKKDGFVEVVRKYMR